MAHYLLARHQEKYFDPMVDELVVYTVHHLMG